MTSYTGGSNASTRIQALEASRRRHQTDVSIRRDNIAAASAAAITKAASTNHFAARSDTVEDLLKSDTVGLVTHRDFKARREYLERCAAGERQRRDAELREQECRGRRARLRKANRTTLSFVEDSDDEDEDDDDDKDKDGNGIELHEGKKRRDGVKGKDSGDDGRKRGRREDGNEENEGDSEEGVGNVEVKTAEVKTVAVQIGHTGARKRRRFGMNPDADTTFLPDREREIAERVERERLKQEWINRQESIKKEMVRITYSYWDGAGHRRMICCKKGTTVGRFLSMVQTQFRELRNTSADALMFIKEDLIIPHHYSFYDFLVTKARGKSGPLFNFDVVEDVRVVADASKEKEDAHAAKVVERRWYERNRHIFPASRWEVYDPTKTYSRYTIHGE